MKPTVSFCQLWIRVIEMPSVTTFMNHALNIQFTGWRKYSVKIRVSMKDLFCGQIHYTCVCVFVLAYVSLCILSLLCVCHCILNVETVAVYIAWLYFTCMFVLLIPIDFRLSVTNNCNTWRFVFLLTCLLYLNPFVQHFAFY